MYDLKFKAHTKEKLDVINYYYKIWFDIVKGQKTYIIDTYAGTGFNYIKGKSEKVLGSALLAVKLFKKDVNRNLTLFLIQKDKLEEEKLRANASDYIIKNNMNIELDKEIKIIHADWASVIDEISLQTQDGISFFLLDPYGIESMPWNTVLSLIKKGKSGFNHKESGFEVLINWAWHKIRRDLGKYYKESSVEKKNGTNTKYKNLDSFFGPVNWRIIADKYPKNIFKDKINNQIEKLVEDLVTAYAINFFEYFHYVKVHPVHARIRTRDPYSFNKGKVWYFLIFASNYQNALKIIDNKFKEYREAKTYSSLPKNQKTLQKFVKIKPKKTNLKKKKTLSITDKIRNLENDLGMKMYTINKKIIKFLYQRKNYDYGCFYFSLFDKFNINENHYSIRFLLENNILRFRKKKAKTGVVYDYYYLNHPRLVDRGEYFFFNENVYEFKNGQLLNLY